MVLLTGASSGLGRELLGELSRLAAQVHVIVHPRHQKANSWNPGDGVRVASVSFCDLADPQATQVTAKEIRDRVRDLDSVILCAGTAVYGPITEAPWSAFERVMDVNYLANVILVKTLLPQLRARSRARIVGIGSGSALMGLRSGSAYTASKAAFHNFCEALRSEWAGSSVRVLHVIPGYMDTPLHTKQPAYPPNGSVPPTGKPRDAKVVAQTILQLARHRQGDVFIGRNPQLAYHLRYWCPPLLRMLVRRRGY